MAVWSTRFTGRGMRGRNAFRGCLPVQPHAHHEFQRSALAEPLQCAKSNAAEKGAHLVGERDMQSDARLGFGPWPRLPFLPLCTVGRLSKSRASRLPYTISSGCAVCPHRPCDTRREHCRRNEEWERRLLHPRTSIVPHASGASARPFALPPLVLMLVFVLSLV